jgi:hypothetical protein
VLPPNSTRPAVADLHDVELELRTRVRLLGDFVEPDDHIDSYAGLILGVFDVNGEITFPIGRMSADVVRIYQAFEYGLPLSDLFDAEEDLFNVFYPAFVEDGDMREDLPPGELLYLRQLELDVEFRRRQIGLAALAETIRILGSGCSIAVLKPMPLYASQMSDADVANGQARLAAYYARLGFRRLCDDGWMLDLTLPDFDRAYGTLREEIENQHGGRFGTGAD